MLIILIAYFVLVYLFARHTARVESNDVFYRGERRSPWLMVAYGMVGASISGVTFVSVPGMTMFYDMTYLQTCLGFIPGYAIVAFVLLPIFYRLDVTSIYTFLQIRLGDGAYRTGACFFILSDLLGTAVKFLLVCVILQRFVFDPLGVPFIVTVPLLVACIWIYTQRGGVRTLVFTDVLQTTFMLIALLLIIYMVCAALDFTLCDAARAVIADGHARVFVFDDWCTTQNFWKQFVSGAFIVVVMTGLNQNMMQKNLTCKTLREAQKDMCLSGLLFVPVNILFLSLGVLLLMFFSRNGMLLPENGDDLLPDFIDAMACSNKFLQLGGYAVRIFFVIGVLSAAFSSADSSLTALTTSFCVDIMRRPDDIRLRRSIHIAMAISLVIVVYIIWYIGSKSLINLVYTLVSYTYGPLLALFVLALSRRSIDTDITQQSHAVILPLRYCFPICLASPIACYILDANTNYHFGYEMLLINALFTFIPLWLLLRRGS